MFRYRGSKSSAKVDSKSSVKVDHTAQPLSIGTALHWAQGPSRTCNESKEEEEDDTARLGSGRNLGRATVLCQGQKCTCPLNAAKCQSTTPKWMDLPKGLK